MQTGLPSRTARAAALHRAAHQVFENGRIFFDPLAMSILGEDSASIAQHVEPDGFGRLMRVFIAVRSRFAEDALAAAVARGVGQLVVLGAGLDTYAYRGALRERLRIFEVDHPATQAWKRERLVEAAIPLPSSLTFAPIDFERHTLAEGLAAAGFDPMQPAFFTWLGVVPYLSEHAIWPTLTYIAALPKGAHVVFDYSDPPALFSPELRERHERRAAHVAELGEPWLTYFEAGDLKDKLRGLGFTEVEDLGPSELACRYFGGRGGKPPDRGGHVVRASRQSVL